MSSGVPSNADIAILSKIASLGSGFNSGIRWNPGVPSQSRRNDCLG
jgi:hypothetical protein